MPSPPDNHFHSKMNVTGVGPLPETGVPILIRSPLWSGLAKEYLVRSSLADAPAASPTNSWFVTFVHWSNLIVNARRVGSSACELLWSFWLAVTISAAPSKSRYRTSTMLSDASKVTTQLSSSVVKPMLRVVQVISVGITNTPSVFSVELIPGMVPHSVVSMYYQRRMP